MSLVKVLGTPEQWKLGLGIVMIGISAGAAPSFVIGGALMNMGISLRGVLWAAAGLMAVATILVVAVVPEHADRSNSTIDWVGAVGIAGWLVPLSLALSQGNAWGWSSSAILTLFGVTVVIMIAWVKWERHTSNPIVPMHLFSNRSMVVGLYATGSSALVAFVYYMTTFSYAQVPAVLGLGLGLTVFAASLLIVPELITRVGFAPWASRSVGRYGARNLGMVGFICAGLPMLGLSVAIRNGSAAVWMFLLASLVWGVSSGIMYTVEWAMALRDVPDSEAGVASGVVTASVTTFGSIGIAVMTALLTHDFIPETPVPTANSFADVYLFLAIYCVVGVGLSFLMPKRDATAPEASGSPATRP